jgi:chromosome segregation ATPase
LVGERARREGAERRDKVLQAQIAKEAEIQQDLKQERDKALNEVAALKATLGELTQARADAEAKHAEAQQALKREHDGVLEKVAALKTTVGELTQARADAEARAVELSQHLKKVRHSKAQEIVRSMGATLSPLIVAAAVATAGFWTYQLILSGPETVSADAAQRQTKAADAKVKTAEAEQQALKEQVRLQTKAATDADAKLRAAEAEQQRLKDEVQRQTKAAADADARRKAAEQQSANQPAPTGSSGPFTMRSNTEADGHPAGYPRAASSKSECEQTCAQSAACKIFTYNKSSRMCYTYSSADLKPNEIYDSGIRD